ncbi:MAG: hypothetical protein LBE03_00045 [Candidatus Nomurabacteria bacterium]|jgi:hypothetical protein|nr:hypothetical protein [Candidatus Nomurabacteria bacterium]
MQDDTNNPPTGMPNQEAGMSPSRWAAPITPNNPGAFPPPNTAKNHNKIVKIGVMVIALLLVLTAIIVPVAMVIKGNEEDEKLQQAKANYMSSCLAQASVMMNNTTINRNVNAKAYCDCAWDTLAATVGKSNLMDDTYQISAQTAATASNNCSSQLEL